MSIEHLSYQDNYRTRMLVHRKIRRAQRRRAAAVQRSFRLLAVTT